MKTSLCVMLLGLLSLNVICITALALTPDQQEKAAWEASIPKGYRHLIANGGPMSYVEENKKLPRVLLMGDSISIGYTVPVRRVLAGKANVLRIPGSVGQTSNGLKNISKWLGKKKWDVIYFNWGLQDAFRNVSMNKYKKNLEELVIKLKASGAKLIWASTTPIPANNPWHASTTVELEYNKMAKAVMEENGIPVDDLHSAIAPHFTKYVVRPNKVNFKPSGCKFLGKLVAKAIKQRLPVIPVDIGSRRELFIDKFLIAKMKNMQLKLNTLQTTPKPKNPPMGLRGLVSGHYATVLKDGNTFRQYCRGAMVPGAYWKTVGKNVAPLNEITIYAESRDGVNWVEPELNLYDIKKIDQRLIDFAKKKKILLKDSPSNIVLWVNGLGHVNHNFTPFIDTKPGIPAAERYKGLGGTGAENGLRAYASPDGIHWKALKKGPVIPGKWGTFDSQNVAFWSEVEGQYVCYFRSFDHGKRAVSRTTSNDFINWTRPVLMGGRVGEEQFYTNGTRPYFRAQHIYIAPATLYSPHNKKRNTRIILMTTRAGRSAYDRTFGTDDFLLDPRVGNRTNYIAFGNGVQTGPKELSFYNVGTRYTLRLDGFGSLHAGEQEGEMVTIPLIFKGNNLTLNFKTGNAGSVRIEIQDFNGKPIPSFGLNDCKKVSGDEIGKVVEWKGGTDLSKFAGKPIRLRFVMKNADVYAFQFK